MGRWGADILYTIQFSHTSNITSNVNNDIYILALYIYYTLPLTGDTLLNLNVIGFMYKPTYIHLYLLLCVCEPVQEQHVNQLFTNCGNPGI